MKQSMQIFTLVIFTLLFVFPRAAMSEVKVSLRNGKEIIADSCRETGARLVCEKMGGTFEIEKKDIREVKGITIKHEKMHESPEEKSGTGEGGQKEAEKSTAGTKDSPKPAEGVLIRGVNPEQEKRLEQINERKAILKPEREKLINEREQLHEDVKNTGVIRQQEQFDAIKKRIADLEAKINGFNDEVKKLNEEEKAIIDSSAVK